MSLFTTKQAPSLYQLLNRGAASTADTSYTSAPAPHLEVVSSPVTQITIEHALPRRYVLVTLIGPSHYRLPESFIADIYYGQHSPVITNEYYVTINFNTTFTGTIRLDY